MNIKIYAENVEEIALSQINDLQCNPAFIDQKIRIMPDVHPGSGCVIGMTSTIGGKVVPNIVGVDIGCGVLVQAIELICPFKKVDSIINKFVPSGFNIHKNTATPYYLEAKELIREIKCIEYLKNTERFPLSMGSLGGGNHFIEIAEDSQKNKYLIVHSGSRNLGLQVANYYENIAKKNNGFIEKEEKDAYMHDMRICQKFADKNRQTIVNLIIDNSQNLIKKSSSCLDKSEFTTFTTVHNYIDNDEILRKGAISAHKNEICIIPLNMRDGSLLCVGKGNEDWNNSAPHGAGRILGRNQAKKTLSLDDFKISMKNIYSSCINQDILEESPMVYKDIAYIKKMITPTVDIIDRLIPVYNFKAK